MTKYYNARISVDDAEELHNLIMKQEDGIANEFDMFLSDILVAHANERKRLMGVRDANILFYINKLLNNTGTMTVFSDAEKLRMANDIIRVHHIFVKSCRGE